MAGVKQASAGVARAIVRCPPVLLLDEPLSALDARIRVVAEAPNAPGRGFGAHGIPKDHGDDWPCPLGL